jgi:peptide/nickel transport system substrate-binding protein
MAQQSRDWTRKAATRRAVLRGAATAGGGGLTLGFIAACGRSDKTSTSTGPGAAAPAAPATRTALDPTQGKRGGKIIIQQYGDPGGGLELVKIRNAGVHQLAGFTHDGLLEFRNGTPAFEGTDMDTQPNLAQAMPEQRDELTYVFKLRPAKFHNGRTVSAEDVKYSYELYAGPDSAWKTDWGWLDKVEAPDPQTVVVKSKYPYADALQSMAQRYASEVLAKEHQESPDAEKKLMGSGAFLFVEYNPPVMTRYKRNPEYHRQPYPYFEEIDFLGTSDPEKKIADFSARQVHMTYWFPPEERDRVKKARPDAQLWSYYAGSSTIFMRSDKPPFNDKRVRQALSMSIDRKALSEGATQGEGEPDQGLSWTGVYWRFRKPKDLGEAAKYWEYNPAEAKKLLAAAGVSLPIKAEMPHWNATVIGQKHVDLAVMIQSQWRNAGIADIKDVELTFGQAAGTISIGNYDSLQWGPNTVATIPDIGITLRNQLYVPPEGIKGPPTLNLSYTNNYQLSALAEKQLGVFDKEERIKVFRAMEDILAEEQYRIAGVTSSTNWFGDPSIKNMQVAREAYNGAIPYVKYWWFEK